MSGPGLAVPPGRAGRLWLQRRLGTAQRGADLLERKLVILQGQVSRLEEAATRTAADWERCQAEAGQWLLRAGLLAGQRAIRLAADGTFAQVTISYAASMGVRYPAEATAAVPAPEGWDGPVLAATRRAHQEALGAAVRHAAAAEALRIVQAEALTTRYRLRAVRDRWIPRLEHALAELTLAIEEQERSDGARLRLARSAGRAARPR